MQSLGCWNIVQNQNHCQSDNPEEWKTDQKIGGENAFSTPPNYYLQVEQRVHYSYGI